MGNLSSVERVDRLKRFLQKCNALGRGPDSGYFIFDKTGEKLVKCTCADTEYLTIPPVRVIGRECFKDLRAGDHFTIFSFPDTVEVIEDYAFASVGIDETSKFDTKNVRSIGSYAFANIKVGDNEFCLRFPNVEKVGAYAFADIKAYEDDWGSDYPLTQLVLGSKLNDIPEGMCFDSPCLEHLVIGGRPYSVGTSAFEGCCCVYDLPDLSCVTHIGRNAFRECGYDFDDENPVPDEKLVRLVLPDCLNELCSGAFSRCEILKSVKLPESMEVIEEGVFEDCKNLSLVTLPPSVRTIKKKAFHSCDNLFKVVIPPSVACIEERAFGIIETGLIDVSKYFAFVNSATVIVRPDSFLNRTIKRRKSASTVSGVLYVSAYHERSSRYGVIDTEDWVTEWVSQSELFDIVRTTGLTILGVDLENMKISIVDKP